MRLLEEQGFTDLVLSLKSSDVKETISNYQRIAALKPYPLHVGITEAGTLSYGTIKSSVGIGTLLALGFGNTIRVSLSADPTAEILVAKRILRSLGLIAMPEVIACPTCGRTEIAVSEMAAKVEEMLAKHQKNVTVAVMGCIVNGPGEASHADFGIAGGKGKGVIFAKGKQLKTVKEEELLPELFAIMGL